MNCACRNINKKQNLDVGMPERVLTNFATDFADKFCLSLVPHADFDAISICHNACLPPSLVSRHQRNDVASGPADDSERA